MDLRVAQPKPYPGWIIMLQVDPTATPPASVAFWTSTMLNCPRRSFEKAKVETQLPVGGQGLGLGNGDGVEMMTVGGH